MGPQPAARAPDAPLLRRTRWRLALWSGGATLATMVILGLLLYAILNRTLAADSEARLRGQANEIQAAVGRLGGNVLRFLTRDDGPLGGPRAGGPGAGTTTIVVQPDGEAHGVVPRDLVGEVPVDVGVQAALAGSDDVRTVSLAGTPFRVRSEPLEIGGQRWALQILDNRAAEQRVLATALAVLLIGGLVVVGASIAFGFLYAGRALVPIRDSLRRQREFAADASHELRTPITVIRASADYLRRSPALADGEAAAAVADISAESERMTRLVDELLLLARADSDAVELRHEPVDLTDVAGAALRGLARLAEERDVRLQLSGEPVRVAGDPDRLRQLVAILVDNAIRHSPAHSAVSVRVAHDGRNAAVTVTDAGPGIRPDDLPRLFDRFFRGAGAPSGGSGLGLAIARWIADRHGGSLSAANVPGGGAAFTLTLPAAG
ncbi:MAG TPA: HAMP domain-containing sensor histidine kinase [Candidatus Limnocylindria bacterium]|nr:HAMP domain-containing sensor histidine kinase [Candidatus Limnocylindria bacterium]